MSVESLLWPIGIMGMKVMGVTNPWSFGVGNTAGLLWTIYSCLSDDYKKTI